MAQIWKLFKTSSGFTTYVMQTLALAKSTVEAAMANPALLFSANTDNAAVPTFKQCTTGQHKSYPSSIPDRKF